MLEKQDVKASKLQDQETTKLCKKEEQKQTISALQQD